MKCAANVTQYVDLKSISSLLIIISFFEEILKYWTCRSYFNPCLGWMWSLWNFFLVAQSGIIEHNTVKCSNMIFCNWHLKKKILHYSHFSLLIFPSLSPFLTIPPLLYCSAVLIWLDQLYECVCVCLTRAVTLLQPSTAFKA